MVTLLQPGARFSKLVLGASPRRVSRSDAGEPFCCVILEGGCRIATDGDNPIYLLSGDFALIPAVHGLSLSSLEPPPAGTSTPPPVALGNGEFRIGVQVGSIDLRMLAGHCSFGSPDASLLGSLLPSFVHVGGEQRLATLVQLVREESHDQRLARDVVLARLPEVLLIEALRSAGTDASPGIVRGLVDARLAAAIRRMHERPTHGWTVAELAKEAALSRSTFFERFGRTVGVAPMQYLLTWRMTLAKGLLRCRTCGVAEFAERVGCNSASTFSTAFRRHVGQSPTRYAQELAAASAA